MSNRQAISRLGVVGGVARLHERVRCVDHFKGGRLARLVPQRRQPEAFGGEIGDAAEGTALTVGSVQGIVAAEGPITLARGVTKQAAFYQGNIAAGSGNAAVIDAVFSPSAFDLSGQDLGGLNLILQHLLALKGGGGTLTM